MPQLLMNNVWVLNFQLYGSLLTPFSLSFAMGVFSLFCCITDTRYGYGYTGTAIRELEKRHSGSIERVSEYRSIGYASIGYGYGWVSEVSVNSDSPVAICVCFPKISASAVCVYLIAA